MELLEPVVERLGYELVEIEFRPTGRGLLRLYIDHPDGVGVDDCETVSREVSAIMDVKDPVPGEYVLEVSSPGEGRHLRKPTHFSDFAGSRVRIEMKTLHEGRRRFLGRLEGIEGDEISVQTDEGLVRLPINGIAKARLAPEAKPAKQVR